MKKQNVDFEDIRDFFLKWNIMQYRIILIKNRAILDFVILDIDPALNRYCLWWRDYSAHKLRYSVFVFGKAFVISLFCC